MSKSISLIFYLFTFGVSILFSAYYQKIQMGNRKGRKILYGALTILPVTIMQGFRYGVGTDFFNYAGIFFRLGTGNTYYTQRYVTEPLFLLENRVLYHIFGNSQALCVANALIMGIFVFLAFDYFKNDVSMPMLYTVYYFWIFPIFFNIERQAVAITIVWFSLRYLIERKPFQYCLWIFVAACFHNSAIIFLFLYAVYLLENNVLRKYAKYILIGVILFSVLFYKRIFLYLGSASSFISKYSIYMVRDGSGAVGTGNGTIIYITLFCAPCILFYKRLRMNKSYNSLWLYLVILNFALSFLNNFFSYGGRMSAYVSIAIINIIGMTYKQISSKNNKFVFIIICLCMFLAYFIRIYYVKGSGEIFPYQTVWNLGEFR